jgi:lipopolysaccharide/colanic/teichoic acid biosynthesis glycosyltransferase
MDIIRTYSYMSPQYRTFIYIFFKRVFDIAFSIIGLIAAFPLMLLVSILICITSPGPLIYSGIRTGMGGKPFAILKFRTMVKNAEKIGGPSTALNDPRMTVYGPFLRRFKLDELPQFLNILKGEMSVVGPRPQVKKYTDLYSGDEKLILTVRPGLTDFATLSFINMDKVLGDGMVDQKYLLEIEPVKNLLRIKYVKERSMKTDFKILILTVLMLVGIKIEV